MENQASDTISSCVPKEIWGNIGVPANSLSRDSFKGM